MHRKHTVKKVRSIFLNMDNDKSGNIYYSEFAEIILEDQIINNLESLKNAFQKIDQNKKNFIDKADIWHLL